MFRLRAEDIVALISQNARFDLNASKLGYSYIMFPLLEMSAWCPTIPDPDDRKPRVHRPLRLLALVGKVTIVTHNMAHPLIRLQRTLCLGCANR